MLGPNDLKIGHQGQVCTLCTFSYQTLHIALDRCVDHFGSKKMSKCHIVTSWLMTSRKCIQIQTIPRYDKYFSSYGNLKWTHIDEGGSLTRVLLHLPARKPAIGHQKPQ